MKKIFVTVVLATSFLSLYSQANKDELKDKEWKLSGVTGVNISQTSLNNWSAGGENSLAGNAYLNGSLKRKSGNWLWINNLILDYGLTKNKSQGMRKTTDKIDFSTQLGYSATKKWYYTVMADFKSQFYKGYNYPDKTHYISKFFAPAYLNLSGGIEYRPKDNYSVYLSPIAGKLTFVDDNYLSDIGAFGVDRGDKLKAKFGAYLKARAEQVLMENVKAITTLDLYTAYDSSFGDIDVNWDLMISMKINRFLSASLNTTLMYDNDVKTFDDNGKKKGAKVQFKEVLGVGLAYNF